MNVTPSGIWTHPGTGRLIDALHDAYPHMVIAMSDHGPTRTVLHTHRISLGSNDIVALPRITSLVHGLTQWYGCSRGLRQLNRVADILIVQLPFDSPLALGALTRPTVYHMCADIKSVPNNSRFRGFLGPASRFAAVSIDALYFKLINSRTSRLIANGQELFVKYGNPKGQWVVSSTISENELGTVSRLRPRNAPLRILYVGYLRRWKGVDILLNAFNQLLADVADAELFIVGPPDFHEDRAADDLRLQIDELGRRSVVRIVGNVPFGPDLFQYYADADVLVVPSRGVEGTPRVVIEARAFGCPVIATDVGGMRSSIEHEVDGLIIPPNDVEACRSALLRIAREPGLRQRLVDNGLARAKSFTVESFAAKFVDELKSL